MNRAYDEYVGGRLETYSVTTADGTEHGHRSERQQRRGRRQQRRKPDRDRRPQSTGGNLTSDVDNRTTSSPPATTGATIGKFSIDASGAWTYTANTRSTA